MPIGSDPPVPRRIVLCLTNDFIGWIPFGLYLRDAWPAFRRQLREDGTLRG